MAKLSKLIYGILQDRINTLVLLKVYFKKQMESYLHLILLIKKVLIVNIDKKENQYD